MCMWYNSFGAARVALVRGGGLCIQFVRRPLHTAMMTCSQLVWVLRPNKVSEWVCSLLSGKFNLTLCACVCVYEQTKRRTHLSKHCIKAGTVLITRTHTHARPTHAHTHTSGGHPVQTAGQRARGVNVQTQINKLPNEMWLHLLSKYKRENIVNFINKTFHQHGVLGEERLNQSVVHIFTNCHWKCAWMQRGQTGSPLRDMHNWNCWHYIEARAACERIAYSATFRIVSPVSFAVLLIFYDSHTYLTQSSVQNGL